MRVLLATYGSIGDLFPMLAIAKALERAGISASIAANPIHERFTSRFGLRFAALGNDVDPTDIPPRADCDETQAFMDFINFNQLDRLYEDLLVSAADADVIVAPYFVVAAHLAAEKLGVPYVACAFSPAYFTRPEVLARMSIAQVAVPPKRWNAELRDFRAKRGLSRRLFPYAAILDDPVALLGLFPEFLADQLTPNVGRLEITGFPHLESHESADTHWELEEFCDARTVVFSFGSFVDRPSPRKFMEESVAACKSLGLKCLYLSQHLGGLDTSTLGKEVLLRPFVHHDAVLPRVSAMVHHGGLGSLMAACRHRKPMIVVPFLYDQPYHSARMHALVDSPQVHAREYSKSTLLAALKTLIERRQAQTDLLTDLMKGAQGGADDAVRAIIAAAANGQVKSRRKTSTGNAESRE